MRPSRLSESPFHGFRQIYELSRSALWLPIDIRTLTSVECFLGLSPRTSSSVVSKTKVRKGAPSRASPTTVDTINLMHNNCACGYQRGSWLTSTFVTAWISRTVHWPATLITPVGLATRGWRFASAFALRQTGSLAVPVGRFRPENPVGRVRRQQAGSSGKAAIRSSHRVPMQAMKSHSVDGVQRTRKIIHRNPR